MVPRPSGVVCWAAEEGGPVMPALWKRRSICCLGEEEEEEVAQFEANARTEAREEVSRTRTWIFVEGTLVRARIRAAASWALEALRQAR